MNIPIIILVVEDEPLIRMEIADDLSEKGFQVLEAPNAHEAMLLLECHSDIALLFTDIDMPGKMNGLMLAAETHLRWPAVKIIVTSGLHSVRSDEIPPGSRFMGKPHQPNAVSAAMLDMVA